MEIIMNSDRKTDCQFFLDGHKGVLLDFTKCFGKKLMLSQVRYLCDNVTTLEEKNNAYYIDDYKYLDKDEMRKYLDEISTELANRVIKGKTYLCSDYCGKYSNISEAYKKMLDEIKLKNYKIIGIPIEQYIDGSWNTKNDNEYVIKVMIPVKIN